MTVYFPQPSRNYTQPQVKRIAKLPDGSTALWIRLPKKEPMPGAQLDKSKGGKTITFSFAWSDQAVQIVKDPKTSTKSLSFLAAATGEQLEDLPLQLHLLLAHAAVTGNLPTGIYCWFIQRLPELLVVQFPSWKPQAENQTNTAILQWVKEILESGQELKMLDGSWNMARAIVYFGVTAWQLDKTACRRWGTTTFQDYDDFIDRKILSIFADAMIHTALHTTLMIPRPGLEEAEFTHIHIWSEWIALQLGPGTAPAQLTPHGIGIYYPSSFEIGSAKWLTDGLDAIQESLQVAATTLLKTIDRPLPRYLGQLIDIAVPGDLLVDLADWGIDKIRVQPQAEGLWVAIWNKQPEPYVLAATWWTADPTSIENVPINMPPIVWNKLHLLLAALWHDLCADAITITTPRPPQEGQPTPKKLRISQLERKRNKTVTLPPIRTIAHAQWAEEADRQLLQKACAVGHGYRRLPKDWEIREDSPETHRRRVGSINRAETHGCPPPPPGFTFVKPYVRGTAQDTHVTPDSPPRVRARGLFTLLHAFRSNLDEFAELR